MVFSLADTLASADSDAVLALVAALPTSSPLDLRLDPAPLSYTARRALELFQQRAATARLAVAYGTSRLDRVRLCVCGPEQVGKTTLVRALGGKVNQRQDSRTVGIDILMLRLDAAAFSVWDFAGQPEFYVTHELLLANPGGMASAVYVVVVSLAQDPAEREATLKYWLRFIASRTASHSGELPQVVLVVTHADAAGADVSAAAAGGLTSKWATLQLSEARAVFGGKLQLLDKPVVLDLRRGSSSLGLRGLTAALQKAYDTVVATAAVVPNCCSALLELMPELRDLTRLASVSDFFALAARYQPVGLISQFRSLFGLSKAKAVHVAALATVQRDILSYLAAMGEIICFPQMARLADAVVLNPRWLTIDLLGSLLAPEILRQSTPAATINIGPDGAVLRRQVAALIEPAAWADVVIEILCHLDLCFARDASLVLPSCLQTSQPEGLWMPAEPLALHYLGRRVLCMQDWDMLSAGLFPRLQTVIQKMLSQSLPPRHPLLWRGGLYAKVDSDVELHITLT